MQSNYQPKAHTERNEDKDKNVASAETSMQTEKIDPTVGDTASEAVAKEEAEKQPVTGVVTNCLKLNVRKTPVEDSTGANVAGTIECLTEVVIDEDASTDKFYKICTATGLEGFCMKKYIAVRRQ